MKFPEKCMINTFFYVRIVALNYTRMFTRLEFATTPCFICYGEFFGQHPVLFWETDKLDSQTTLAAAVEHPVYFTALLTLITAK